MAQPREKEMPEVDSYAKMECQRCFSQAKNECLRRSGQAIMECPRWSSHAKNECPRWSSYANLEVLLFEWNLYCNFMEFAFIVFGISHKKPPL